MLIRHLNGSADRLTTFIIGNHMMQLRAQSGLSSDVGSPAWLGEAPRLWPAEEILACRNQLIHLPSLVTNAEYACRATPRFFTPVALDYDFDAAAPRPENWLAFLNQLWPDDPQSIATLQEWFGYCLTLDTRQQKMLTIVGPPRSGKGTIARVLARLVGDRNVASPTLSSLGDRFGLWPLLGKSVAIFPDARLGRRTESSVAIKRVLSILAEESLAIDRKHMPVVESKLHTRLMFLSNDLPRFAEVSAALAERMVILRLSRSWFGREDPELFERLAAEIAGILRWAVEGWQRLFTSPRLCLRSSCPGIEQR
jgi:putative DNA primase/helicase